LPRWIERLKARQGEDQPLDLNPEVEADLKAAVMAACRLELEVNKLWPIDA